MFNLWTEGHDAFSKIYQHFSKPVLRYVRSRVADAAVAEELTQDVFLKAYRFRATYQEKYAVSTWLWTIARNTVADHLRGRRPETSELDPEKLVCDRPSAESQIMRKDERRRFMRMLSELTRLQKRVIWMRVIHQLSYEEISHSLGMSLSSVKNLAYRARITLTELAQSAGEGLGELATAGI